MPRKSKSPHVTWLVSSTSSRPVQKSRKPKFQPQNHSLSREIRRRKFMVEKLANRGRHNPSKRHRAERKQEKLKKREQRVQHVQRPIEASAENDASMNTTSKLPEMPEKREFPPMYKGVILGLMIGTGLSAEQVASKIPDQFLELLFKTPSVLFRNMQFPDENLSRQSGPSAENLSQEPQHGSTAVVGNPSQNLEVSPGCSNQTKCPDKTIDLTSIYTQTDSWSPLQKHGKEPAPLVIHSMPNLVPIQEEDQMLKPDEDPAQKTEVCLNQSEGQIGDGDCNAGDCHPQSQIHKNQ